MGKHIMGIFSADEHITVKKTRCPFGKHLMGIFSSEEKPVAEKTRCPVRKHLNTIHHHVKRLTVGLAPEAGPSESSGFLS